MSAFAAYDASAPRDPAANDLEAWARQRYADLTGTGSLETVLDNPLSRSLVAFGFVLYSQYQDRPLPAITRSEPVSAKKKPDQPSRAMLLAMFILLAIGGPLVEWTNKQLGGDNR